jgi:two-component system NarL family sensor kinase
MKNLVLFCILVFVMLNIRVNAQQFGNQAYYLLDSIYIPALSKHDKDLLDSTLQLYHSSSSDTVRINVLVDIVESSYDLLIWPRYNKFLLTAVDSKLETKEYGDGHRSYFLNVKAICLTKKGYATNDRFTQVRLYRESIEIAEEINNDRTLGAAYNALGCHFYEIGNIDSCVHYFTLENDLAINESTRADLYNNLGAIANVQGDAISAIEYYEQSRQVNKKVGDASGEAVAIENIAQILQQQGDFETALNYHQESYSLAADHNDVATAAIAFLGVIQCKIDLPEKHPVSIDDLKHATVLFKMSGSTDGEAILYMEIANFFSHKNEYDSAHFYLNQSMILSKASDNTTNLAYAFIELGYLLMREGKLQPALQNAEAALQFAEYVQEIRLLRDANELLYKIEDRLGHSDASLRYVLKFAELRDSIQSVNNNRASLRWEFERNAAEARMRDSLNYMQKRSDQLLVQEKERASAEQKQASQNLWILGLSGVVIVLVLLGLIVNIRNKRIRVTRNLKQQRELVNAMIHGEEDERERIARELHDGVGAALMATRFKMRSGHQDEAYEMMQSIISEVRGLSHKLIPPEISDNEITDTIKNYLDTMRSELSFDLNFSSFGDFSRCGQELKVVLYRVTQECLSNTIKYAEASELNVQLTADEEGITLMIDDDGKGFQVKEQREGIGVNNIRSRVKELGGQVEIDSTPGHGTTVIITLVN